VGATVAALGCLRFLFACLGKSRDLRAADASGRRWHVLIVPLVVAVVVFALWGSAAEPRVVGGLMIAIVLALIACGMPIAIALLLGGFLGLALLRHDFTVATRTLALAAEGTISEYVFATVPLFVLMGLFVNISDIGRDAFRAAQRIFGRSSGPGLVHSMVTDGPMPGPGYCGRVSCRRRRYAHTQELTLKIVILLSIGIF
jgi:hypothetical protein